MTGAWFAAYITKVMVEVLEVDPSVTEMLMEWFPTSERAGVKEMIPVDPAMPKNVALSENVRESFSSSVAFTS